MQKRKFRGNKKNEKKIGMSLKKAEKFYNIMFLIVKLMKIKLM